MKKKMIFGEAIALANSRANDMFATEEEKRIYKKPQKVTMKLRYVGQSFGIDSLTNGRIYDVIGKCGDMLRVIDDSGEDYLYFSDHPAPLDGSSPGGKWEMVAGETILYAFDMIEEFICGKYDPIAFSYDLPDYLVESFDKMVAENAVVAEILNEKIPEICAEYERGMDPTNFINKIKEQYDMVHGICCNHI